MQLTRAADYAIRVMLCLAAYPRGSRLSRGQLAQAANVPEPFLGKVLQALVRARLIVSHRGAAGGFTLAQDPGRVSILDVVEAVEGPVALNACLGATPDCPQLPACPAHEVWREAQDAMTGVLDGASLASLVTPASPFQPIAEHGAEVAHPVPGD